MLEQDSHSSSACQGAAEQPESHFTPRNAHLQQRGSRPTPQRRFPTFLWLPGTPRHTHARNTRGPPSYCPLARGVRAGACRGSKDREQAVYRETIQPCLQSRLASAHRSPCYAWRRSQGTVGDRNILCSSSQAVGIQ